MAGFSGVDALLNANTTLGLHQFRWFTKTMGIASVAGRHYLQFTQAGDPGAAAYSGTRALVQVNGGSSPSHPVLTFVNATSSRKIWGPTVYTASGDATASTGRLTLIDVIAYYAAIDCNTTTNTLTNVLSIPRYTTGAGVHMLLDVTTTLGATSRTITITYTDQDGNAGNTTAIDLLGSMPAQTIGHRSAVSPFPSWWIPFASGDYGVRSVQSANLSAAMGAGVASLVLFKPLLSIAIPAISTPYREPPEGIDPSILQELPDNVALSWIYSPGAAAPAAASFSGEVRVSEG